VTPCKALAVRSSSKDGIPTTLFELPTSSWAACKSYEGLLSDDCEQPFYLVTVIKQPGD
jgi:hypothetical protein